MKNLNPQKNNWNNWNWNSRQLSFFSKRLIISHLSRNEKVTMKHDTSKKTAPKVLKLGKMNENSAIFALTDIKIHARTYRSDDFPCSRSARNWSQIHVSRPHLEGIMRHNGQSCSRIGRDKGQFTNITEAIPHRTLAYLWCRNEALRLKKTSKITSLTGKK